jgi:ribonuclease HIII
MDDFRARCRNLIDRAEQAGWIVVSERAIPYGRMYVLGTGGAETATLSCYHGKKGFRHVVAGKRADDLAETLGADAPARPGQGASQGTDPFGLGVPRVGADESGKGDYFGPLVVAAWLLEDGATETLHALRVADSKTLGNASAQRIAGRLDALDRGAVRVLMPREYNARYAEARNLNVLLAEEHAACVRALIAKHDARPRAVVVDQFARSTRVLDRGLALPAGCRLVTRTKGEADPAVAAASVLARAAFLDGLRALGQEFGHELPAGAGAPTMKAARSFVATFGHERLTDVAKVHFATTRKL